MKKYIQVDTLNMILRLFTVLFPLFLKGIASYCLDPPVGCPSDVIGFYLYNENYEDGYQMFLENENTIKNALFVSGAHPKGIGIKIVIHGYAQSRNSETMIRLRQEYFINNKKWNVLYIDFEKLAQDYCYVQLFESVPIIGKCASQFLRLLVQLRPDITCDQLDVLAFSIGCHVAAETSNNFPLRIPNSSIQPLPTDCFSRIIGNDPASPLFYKNLVTVQNKLNKQHAKFVMAIHTTVLVGVISSQAHVDAYANNSIHQPGCGYTDLRCSHLRALLYFIESINSNVGFTATKCDYFIPVVGKCAVLGDNTIRVGEPCKAVQEKDQGNYVFNTNEKPPFAKSVTNL